MYFCNMTYCLSLYFPMTSILVIKNVTAIPNDEYTRHLLYTKLGALVLLRGGYFFS